MEKEVIIEDKVKPRSKRRLSLFKRRKKPNIRPFVKEKRTKQGKRILMYVLITAFALFFLTGILIAIKNIILYRLVSPESKILSPQGEAFADKNQVENLIKNKGLEAENIIFASDSAVVSFIIKKRTTVTLSLSKDLRSQIDLIESIDKQIIMDGKQAISIDLRYNKPIVKF